MDVKRLGVIGTGLIGASVGLAAKRAGVEHVAGYDFYETARETAKGRGAIDELCITTDELLADGVDLVVVAAPVLALPTILADVLEGHGPRAAAGGSLRDMTRVAGANPRIWVDIFLENAGPLQESLAEHRRRVEQLEGALRSRDAGFLGRWIGEAAGNRRRMLGDAYPDPGELQQLRVHVPDRPGVLAGITQALGAERINIEDFELHHVSPDRGGTLTLLVGGEDEARRAAGLLEAQGYGVVVSPVVDE